MNIVATILLIIGLFFFTGGSIGILRFPDFYSRLHPAGKCDSMGLLKILMIVVFVSITSPTATHAIVDAGVRAGLSPWTKSPQTDEDQA